MGAQYSIPFSIKLINIDIVVMSIAELRKYVIKSLAPLISKKVALLEVPHYFNIGDTLIWEGELRFLSKLKREIVYSTSSYNYDEKKQLKEDVTIILQGGGNFGDIWKEPHEFRKKVIRQYPQNRIIIFPQTIYYKYKQNLISDAVFFSNYSNVIICARDNESLYILQKYFNKNKILLIPDMAIFINVNKNILIHKGNNILFAKRKDQEFEDLNYSFIPSNAKIHDWPTFEGFDITSKFLMRTTKFFNIVDKFIGTKISKMFIDYYWLKRRKNKIINTGINFIKDYNTIYTTRLHIGILGLLMNKNVIFLDNNYGKLSNFYNTWLKDIKIASLYKNIGQQKNEQ